MSIASIPLALFLLLPGFLFINAAFLVSRIRKLSAFQATAWSIVASLFLVVIIYPTYALLVNNPDGAWPGLLEVLESPGLVPGHVWIVLYALAPVLGSLVGLGDRRGYVEDVFRRVGIDLRVHGDLWGPRLREAESLRVYLKDGTLLFGWPEYYSSDRSQPGPELYLSRVRIWNTDESKWVEMEGVRGILLDASEISRMEFLELPSESE